MVFVLLIITVAFAVKLSVVTITASNSIIQKTDLIPDDAILFAEVDGKNEVLETTIVNFSINLMICKVCMNNCKYSTEYVCSEPLAIYADQISHLDSNPPLEINGACWKGLLFAGLN